jgi:hypothetical protein
VFAERASLGVLESIEPTVPLWQHVSIDSARLAELAASIAPGSLSLPCWNAPVFTRRDADTLAGQILLFNAINFCYWGDPKWEMSYAGETYDGSFGMLMAVQRALDEGLPLLDGAYLANLGEADFRHILRGRGALHLLPERLAIWRAAGLTLVTEFGGRWPGAIAAAGGDALALVRLLVERFRTFDDRETLDGREIRFFKRAQLAAGMLYEAFAGQGYGALAGVERLTVFADYKLPQVLRRLGILIYGPRLAEAVDSLTLIPAGDRCEVEMRAAAVWAAELLRRVLAPHDPAVTALHLDYWLWAAGQAQGPDLKPYHRTLTTAY